MSTAVRRAIFGKLAGDTTLREYLSPNWPAGYNNSIYHNQAPEEAGYPFIVFHKQSGSATETMTSPNALVEELWTVRGVDQNDSADNAEKIAGRIGYLLDDAVLSLANDENTSAPRVLVYSRGTSDVEYSEVDGGKTYHHVGAIFRVVWT